MVVVIMQFTVIFWLYKTDSTTSLVVTTVRCPVHPATSHGVDVFVNVE